MCIYTYMYVYTTEYYSAVTKDEIMPFAVTWVDLETVIMSKVRERQIYDITYMQSLKKWYKRMFFQDRDGVTDVGNKHGHRGRTEGRISWETGIDAYV